MRIWWRRFRRFISLSGKDRRVLFSAGLAIVFVKAGLRLMGFARFRGFYARVLGENHRKQEVQDTERQVWAVKTAAAYLGASCLPQALALKFLLRFDSSSNIVIGVLRQEGRFEAHAWVEKQGSVLLGELPGQHFSRLWEWQ